MDQSGRTKDLPSLAEKNGAWQSTPSTGVGYWVGGLSQKCSKTWEHGITRKRLLEKRRREKAKGKGKAAIVSMFCTTKKRTGRGLGPQVIGGAPRKRKDENSLSKNNDPKKKKKVNAGGVEPPPKERKKKKKKKKKKKNTPPTTLGRKTANVRTHWERRRTGAKDYWGLL